MNSINRASDCQIPCLQSISTDTTDAPNKSLLRRLKLAVRRRLSPQQERKFKMTTNKWMNQMYQFLGKNPKPVSPVPRIENHLAAGDRVRVRSKREIDATLNNWRQLKGCTFMPEMAKYCGTTQCVLTPMQRFVDERDLRVKKCSGIVLLKDVVCHGTADFGPCDRNCFLFWREEWLEKLN